ncbi:hypothetical protein DENIS_0581 [Desulfonema ishimotonii]|uniref:Ice-binding protein C-terminal domain-containing protein n=2 Tax=Desulfonema ishimotonii TaxID=45657 RepID=A0A401FRP5_9BACT|nr:hypothetical protein DENIS_0581 [Desulfonema ishimotonii]
MKFYRVVLFRLVVLMILMTSGLAQGDPVTFFGEDVNPWGWSGKRIDCYDNSVRPYNDFISRLNGVSTESFENLATGHSDAWALDFGETGVATISNQAEINSFRFLTLPLILMWAWIFLREVIFAQCLTGAKSVENVNTTDLGTSRWFSTGEDQFLFVQPEEQNFLEGSSFTLEFTKAQSAFGFFGTDFQLDLPITIRFETVSGKTTVLDIPFTRTPAIIPGSVLFMGVIDTDDPFVKVIFDSPGNPIGGWNLQEWFAFDQFTIATPEQVNANQPVPEPATLILLAISLIGFAVFKRKCDPRL